MQKINEYINQSTFNFATTWKPIRKSQKKNGNATKSQRSEEKKKIKERRKKKLKAVRKKKNKLPKKKKKKSNTIIFCVNK